MRPIDADTFAKRAYEVAYPVVHGYNEHERGLTLMGIAQLLDEQPTIESELKRGRWEITDAYPHNVYCSECYTRFAQTHWAVWEDGSLPRKFCPNCGARMESEQ